MKSPAGLTLLPRPLRDIIRGDDREVGKGKVTLYVLRIGLGWGWVVH